jgi:hypothetical protein
MAATVETSQVDSILKQIGSLRDDERLILHDVTWEEYQELLDELGENWKVSNAARSRTPHSSFSMRRR